jgi:predicted MFS family arabinose efflux permease
MLRNKLALQAYLMIALAMFARFMIIPNISTHIQVNLHYPRARIGLLYLLGGSVSFFTMRLAGKLTDRTSSTFTISIFTALLIAVTLAGFVFYTHATPITLLFPLFMVHERTHGLCANPVEPNPAPARSRCLYVGAVLVHAASFSCQCVCFVSHIGARAESITACTDRLR